MRGSYDNRILFQQRRTRTRRKRVVKYVEHVQNSFLVARQERLMFDIVCASCDSFAKVALNIVKFGSCKSMKKIPMMSQLWFWVLMKSNRKWCTEHKYGTPLKSNWTHCNHWYHIRSSVSNKIKFDIFRSYKLSSLICNRALMNWFSW